MTFASSPGAETCTSLERGSKRYSGAIAVPVTGSYRSFPMWFPQTQSCIISILAIRRACQSTKNYNREYSFLRLHKFILYPAPESLMHNGYMRSVVSFLILALFWLCTASSQAQVIEFESGGLHYQTLTRNGITMMFSYLRTHIRAYSILQVVVSNGAKIPCVVKVEDLRYEKSDGSVLHPTAPGEVVSQMIEKARGGDVIKLVSTYESAVYGMARIQSTNGYEQRRQSALALTPRAKLKAAATASAIAFISMKLGPGESTDGAVFFSTNGKPIGAGKFVGRANTNVFEFNPSE